MDILADNVLHAPKKRMGISSVQRVLRRNTLPNECSRLVLLGLRYPCISNTGDYCHGRDEDDSSWGTMFEVSSLRILIPLIRLFSRGCDVPRLRFPKTAEEEHRSSLGVNKKYIFLVAVRFFEWCARVAVCSCLEITLLPSAGSKS